MSDARSEPGRLLDLEVDAPAAGGSCVARHGGRVVFVRHALPGERVRAEVTEDPGGSFLRADAVEIVRVSPERVEPPCPHARPSRCGGCDWQHASAAAQRRMKAAVVRDQFRRLAGMDVDLVEVESLPGGLLGWRTRIAWAVGDDGVTGLHQHRSHAIEPIAHCPLGVPEVADAPNPPRPAGPGALIGYEVVSGDETHGGESTLLAHYASGGRRTPHGRTRRQARRTELVSGPRRVRRRVGQDTFEVDAAGFWQVHPAALETFAAALLDGLAPRAGEHVLDLYAGAGALTAVLGKAVGPTGSVVGVESSRVAVADAAENLRDMPWCEVRHGSVDPELPARFADGNDRPDLVVLDPPRAGLGVSAMRAVLGLRPRALGYVSCDAATLARDVAAARQEGWQLRSLRVFDAFPMTAHVESVAVLTR